MNKDLKVKLLSEYRDFESLLDTAAAASIHKMRLEGKKSFETIGFPSGNNEEWRFTNIKPIINRTYKQTFKDKLPDYKNISDISKYLIPNLEAYKIVFINGRYIPSLSNINTEEDISVDSFKNAQRTNPNILSEHYGKYADFKTDGFTALNTAYANDGCFVTVRQNSKINKPLIILNLAIPEKDDKHLLSQPRNLFIFEENSVSEIIEIHEGNAPELVNSVSEIILGKNSELHHTVIYNYGKDVSSVDTTQVYQNDYSRLFSTVVVWGGSLTRKNLNSDLGGSGIDCYFRGFYLVGNDMTVDNHTLADHAMPNSHSNELYKGIIYGNGNAVFNGKIMVRPDAQKTNAYQTNNNILLSDTATVNSKPQLEIFADDVKCSHGATTGQLNKEEMFYLRTRGIGKEEAGKILLFAYAGEVIQEVKNDTLREHLLGMLSEKLDEVSL